MDNKINHHEKVIKGLSLLTEIEESKIREYVKENNLLNILEHPYTIDPTQEQLKKLLILNEFIGHYQIIQYVQKNKKTTINSTDIAGKYFATLLGRKKDKEVFAGIFLDTKNQIIETKIFSEGNINSTVIFPRNILKQALACDCKNIIFAHNHPTGITKPSKEDIQMTQKLINIFHPLGIKILDHIIVGDNTYLSMANKRLLPELSDKAIYDPIPITENAFQYIKNDEKFNKRLIKIFKKLESMDVKIKKLNADIHKHIGLFEIPEESKDPIVIDLINMKELYIIEYNSLLNVAKNLADTNPKAIRLKCDYFIKNFSNTQNSLDYINSNLKGKPILDGTKELFTSLAYNSTVSSYSPLNIYYVSYKLPQIFGQEVTVIYDQMEQEKSNFNEINEDELEL